MLKIAHDKLTIAHVIERLRDNTMLWNWYALSNNPCITWEVIQLGFSKTLVP